MSSDFQQVLRRLKSEKHHTQLKPRDQSKLEFFETTHERPAKLLYDTTVYIDILHGHFTQIGKSMLQANEAWHSPVTEAELAASCGRLDPSHVRTRENIELIREVIESRPRHRTITPDVEIWQEAGILSGLVSRLQGYATNGQRRVLNDALLFASARKHGCAVLTRNVVDFDFLQQLEPSGKVLFYR